MVLIRMVIYHFPNVSFNRIAYDYGHTTISQLTASTSISLRINTPPSTPSVLLAGTITASDTLTATIGSPDVDGDTVTHTYAWYENSPNHVPSSTIASSNSMPESMDSSSNAKRWVCRWQFYRRVHYRDQSGTDRYLGRYFSQYLCIQ